MYVARLLLFFNRSRSFVGSSPSGSVTRIVHSNDGTATKNNPSSSSLLHLHRSLSNLPPPSSSAGRSLDRSVARRSRSGGVGDRQEQVQVVQVR